MSWLNDLNPDTRLPSLLTGGGVPYEEGHDVGDGGLPLGELVGGTAGGGVTHLLSRGHLVHRQVVLLLEELPSTRGEPWYARTRTHTHTQHKVAIPNSLLYPSPLGSLSLTPQALYPSSSTCPTQIPYL